MSILIYCFIGLCVFLGILLYEIEEQGKEKITTSDIPFFLACVFGWTFLVVGCPFDLLLKKLFKREKTIVTIIRLRK